MFYCLKFVKKNFNFFRKRSRKQAADIRQTDRQASKQAEILPGRQTDRQVDRQIDRQTDRQADKHAGRQTGRRADVIPRELSTLCQKNTWENDELAKSQDILGKKVSQKKSRPKKLFRNPKGSFHFKYFIS